MKEAFGQAAQPLPSMEFLGSSLVSIIQEVRLGKVFISYKPKGKCESISFINFLFKLFFKFKLFCNSKFPGFP